VRAIGSGVGAVGRPLTLAMNTSSAACRYTFIVYGPTWLLTWKPIVSPGRALPAEQYPSSGLTRVESGGFVQGDLAVAEVAVVEQKVG